MPATGGIESPADPADIRDPQLREPDWKQYQPNGFRESPLVTGTIDVGAFVKAQAKFRKAQTIFLQNRVRAEDNPGEYIHQLTQYSLAQADLIEAQDEVLHALGVV